MSYLLLSLQRALFYSRKCSFEDFFFVCKIIRRAENLKSTILHAKALFFAMSKQIKIKIVNLQ